MNMDLDLNTADIQLSDGIGFHRFRSIGFGLDFDLIILF